KAYADTRARRYMLRAGAAAAYRTTTPPGLFRGEQTLRNYFLINAWLEGVDFFRRSGRRRARLNRSPKRRRKRWGPGEGEVVRPERRPHGLIFRPGGHLKIAAVGPRMLPVL